MPAPTRFHPGEIAAQEARGWGDDFFGERPPLEDGLSTFYASFFAQLDLLPVAALDAKGRPWASILAADARQSAPFIQSASMDHPSEREKEGGTGTLTLTAPVPRGVPLREALREGVLTEQEEEKRKLMAAVGVMLHNARRNKLEGYIRDATLKDRQDEVTLDISVSSIEGNCPKYINRRLFAPAPYEPKILAPSSLAESDADEIPDLHPGEKLPKAALEIIAQADLLYLATRHTAEADAYPPDRSSLGANIRGGRRGFLRHYYDEEKKRPCLVLPDFSGNKLMQSIGNLFTDPVAGMAIPHFGYKSPADGSVVRPTRVLHVTGPAEVLVGEEAKKLMRGVTACVRVWVEAYTVVEGALPLVLDGTRPMGTAGRRAAAPPTEADGDEEVHEDDAIDWSPYNPPLRLLNSEVKSGLQVSGGAGGSGAQPSATLDDVTFWTPELATFHWSVPAGVGSYEAGQYVVLDCSEMLETRIKMYSHMARFRGGEKELNDDGVRSWTISSRPQLVGGAEGDSSSGGRLRFSTTVKRKNRGAATPGLFHNGRRIKAWQLAGSAPGEKPQVEAPLLGFDGAWTLPSSTDGNSLKLLYMAHGIGLTPVLSHLDALAHQKDVQADVLVVFAAKATELDVLDALLRQSAAQLSAAGDRVKLRFVYLERPAEAEDELYTNITPEMISKPTVPGDSSSIVVERRQGQRVDGTLFSSLAPVVPIEDVLSRAVYVCGTKAFDKACKQALKLAAAQAGSAVPQTIVSESFSF